jgi:hypothetical protein
LSQLQKTGSVDNREFWLNVLVVQNGLEVYCTWTIVASFVNSVVAAVFQPAGAASQADPAKASITAVAILVVVFLLWFPLEITVFDKYTRYAITQYAGMPATPMLCDLDLLKWNAYFHYDHR